MKKSIMNLVKDLLIAAPLFLFSIMLFSTENSMEPAVKGMLTFAISGIPFGWRWASNIITAVSLKGIGLKALISAFLGCVAMPIALGGDVIRVLSALIKTIRNSNAPKRSAARASARSAARNG